MAGAPTKAARRPLSQNPDTAMTTRLDKALKREITVEGTPYTVTIDPEGIRIVPKGKRK